MATTQLLKIDWRSYCDRISRGLSNARAEVEVASLAIGDRIEAKWLPLYGVTYDARSDVIEIVLEGVDHMISHPKDLYVERTRRGLVALDIVEADETRQTIKLREPLLLPAASPRRSAGKSGNPGGV